MKNETEIKSLQTQLQVQHTDLNSFHTESMKLQEDYDLGMMRIQQLEKELNDVLYYKRNILEKMQSLESLALGEGSRLGNIHFSRQGLLEGRFLERVQSRCSERHSKQAAAVETIRENVSEIKRKAEMIEDEIEAERKNLMYVDNLISTNQATIQAKRMRIAQLESSIRVLT